MRITQFRIRPTMAADIETIADIYGFHVRNGCATFELEPPAPEEMGRRHARLAGAGLPYLSGEADGRVVGYAYAGQYRPRPGYRYTVEDSIYISPEWQGRGLGRLLLAELIAQCEQQGFRQMVAVIGDSGNAASIGLHEAFGFRNAGVLQAVGFKFGRWVDSVLMQRRIGDGERSVPA